MERLTGNATINMNPAVWQVGFMGRTPPIEVVSRVRWPMHTGRVIKRMACGYRDSEFFFMKIKSDFPAIREEPFYALI
ncbi:hypothetical protein V8U11_06290 [Pseudomonas chlororaphis]|uniref:hypothetical protein n=1 Tax=Pseudomonas chlororaphis TaxID=587753 RepID=UPI0030CAEE5C